MGRDKRALPWIPRPDGSPQTVLQHVVTSLSNQISDIVLVANDEPDVRDVRIVSDMYPNAGSLGGIYSGLKAANHELAFVAAADMPFLNLDLILALAKRSANADAVVPVIQERPEPLHAFYRKTLLSSMCKRIERKELKISAVFNGFDTVWVTDDDLRINDPDLCSFQNLNTPHDYEQALAQVRT